MVSFSCEGCGDVLTKKKLDQHRNQCRGATFTCLDCMVHFLGTDYRLHTSCISEAQKYQGHLYKEKTSKSSKGDKRKSMHSGSGYSSAMVPLQAYVEDVPEGEDAQAVAIIDVPPRAPTPPPAAAPQDALPEGINVFDYLVTEASPSIQQATESRMLESAHDRRKSRHSQHPHDAGRPQAERHVSYGSGPVQASLDRYDSWHNIPEPRNVKIVTPAESYTTPAPKERKQEKKDKHVSDKKRKRHTVDDLDLTSSKARHTNDEVMADAPPTTGRVLHSGLTGGLNKLVTDPEFYEDRIDAGPTPVSAIQRSRRDEELKKEHRKSSHGTHGSSTMSKASTNGRQDDRARFTQSIDPGRSHDVQRLRNDRHRESLSSDEQSTRPSRKHLKTTESSHRPERPMSVQPDSSNQMVSYSTRAELFFSFVKGPESERGYSINKILKHYHRERGVRSDEKEEEDKELWKSLRLRKNDRGEVVLFI